ncbi:MAG: GGDEF domain-containing protein [Gaiellaceae bacterium]
MSHGLEILLILLAAGLFATAAAGAAWLAGRKRASAGAEAQVTAIVEQLTGRVDELAADLRRALERAESEGRRGRFAGELAASLDLDDVLARALDAARDLPGVDAAVASVDEGDARIVASVELPLEQAEAQSFVSPDPDVESIAVQYRFVMGESQLRSALAVPLVAEGARVGFIAIYTRDADRDLEDEAGADLRQIAERTGPAVGNALRFREARRLADLDALTGLHNRRYFHETLERECARARRYERRLALVLLDLDDFKAINERIGHLAGDAVLAEAAERLRGAVRSADIACRVGGDEFAVVLPEAGIGQAEQLYRRIESAVSGRPVGHVAQLGISAGVAELQERDDAKALFERADAALYQAKDAGKARVFPAPVLEPGNSGAA